MVSRRPFGRARVCQCSRSLSRLHLLVHRTQPCGHPLSFAPGGKMTTAVSPANRPGKSSLICASEWWRGPEQGIFSATWRASASSPTGQAFRRMGTKARRTGQFPSFRKAQIARSSQQLTGLERRIELLGRHHFARRDPSREMVQRELAGMIKPRPPPSARSASAWWRRESLQPDVVCRLAEGAGRLIRQGNLVICSKSV